MRRMLVEHARARRAAKRGGGPKVTLLDEQVVAHPPRIEILALEALDRLRAREERLSQVVELHYFGASSSGRSPRRSESPRLPSIAT